MNLKKIKTEIRRLLCTKCHYTRDRMNLSRKCSSCGKETNLNFKGFDAPNLYPGEIILCTEKLERAKKYGLNILDKDFEYKAQKLEKMDLIISYLSDISDGINYGRMLG